MMHMWEEYNVNKMRERRSTQGCARTQVMDMTVTVTKFAVLSLVTFSRMLWF